MTREGSSVGCYRRDSILARFRGNALERRFPRQTRVEGATGEESRGSPRRRRRVRSATRTIRFPEPSLLLVPFLIRDVRLRYVPGDTDAVVVHQLVRVSRGRPVVAGAPVTSEVAPCAQPPLVARARHRDTPRCGVSDRALRPGDTRSGVPLTPQSADFDAGCFAIVATWYRSFDTIPPASNDHRKRTTHRLSIPRDARRTPWHPRLPPRASTRRRVDACETRGRRPQAAGRHISVLVRGHRRRRPEASKADAVRRPAPRMGLHQRGRGQVQAHGRTGQGKSRALLWESRRAALVIPGRLRVARDANALLASSNF